MCARYRWAMLAGLLASLGCRSLGEPGASQGPPTWVYATEQEWLVATVVQSLVDMTSFAGGGGRSSAKLSVSQARDESAAPVFSVAIGEGTRGIAEKLSLGDYVWSPAAYVALARRLLETAKVGRSDATLTNGEELLAALTDLRAAEIEKQNAAVSKALTVSPASADLHEAAALLLGAFALRESAGAFADPRVPFCRMAAHLALAQALRGQEGGGAAGRYAEITLLALVNRQADALEKLAALKPVSPGERAWDRALRMRIVGDWRMLGAPETASLLEKLQYLRAIHEARLGERFGQFLDQPSTEAVPDWGRVAFQSWHTGATVEDCGRFAGEALDLEMQESAAVGVLPAVASPLFVARLNEEPWRSPVAAGQRELRVIDPGLWAAFGQRHILAQAAMVYYCSEFMWGQREEGRRVVRENARRLGGLRLYPVLAKRCSFEDRERGHEDVSHERTEYERAMPGAVALCRTRPELVTAANWQCLREKPPFANLYPGVPKESAWFKPSVPTGTAFEWQYRLSRGRGADPRAMPHYESRARIAPYDSDLAFNFVQTKYGDRPPFEPLREAYHGCEDFDTGCMYELAEAAKRSDPAEYIRGAQRLCDLDKDQCFSLGEYLAVHEREDEAAEVFRKWARDSRDRVAVSNSLEWLVRYDFAHGRRAEALEWAHEAAAVGSGRGIETLAKVLELRGDLKEAEEQLDSVRTAYDDIAGLTAFYYRQVEAGGRSRAGALSSHLKDLFPRGLERHWAATAPADGLWITGGHETIEAAGLQRGDIIMAVNGIRVHNVSQFRAVVDFDTDPEITVTVWRAAKSFEARLRPKYFVRPWVVPYPG